MHERADVLLGAVATAIGTTGATIQIWGDIGNLFLIGLNVIVAGGGIYLVSLRIRIARRDLRGPDEPPDKSK